MGEFCEERHHCGNKGCDFDLDMSIWVLIIIVIGTCMCNN